MMTLTKSIIASAALLVGTTIAANAQAQYQPYPAQRSPYSQPNRYSQPHPYSQPYPYNQVPAGATSWNYDPYTSGLIPSPNRSNGS